MTVWRLFPQRDLFSEWSRLTREMDRLMSSLAGRSAAAWSGVYPPVNLSEDDDNFYVRAELPGVAPADLDISVVGDSLTLRGERKIPVSEGVNYHRRERTAGVFRRVITLPSPVKPEAVEAVSKNGVLTVTLPKADEAKPRQIKVDQG